MVLARPLSAVKFPIVPPWPSILNLSHSSSLSLVLVLVLSLSVSLFFMPSLLILQRSAHGACIFSLPLFLPRSPSLLPDGAFHNLLGTINQAQMQTGLLRSVMIVL